MARRSLKACVGFLIAMLTIPCHGQTRQLTSPCDLLKNPAQYSGKVVTIRAGVSIGFENFTLLTPGCDESARAIWLAYGGDEPTPTVSTVNDQSRTPGSVLKVNGRPVILHRNDALELFKKRLSAERLGGITGQGCPYGCRLYKVAATLTGVFFAASARPLGGYGHLGCCHLLAIEEVADVDAQRTQVPVGGRFICTTDSFQIDSSEAQALEEKRERCHGFNECRQTSLEEIAEVARQWEPSIDQLDRGIVEPSQDTIWNSPDMLKYYSIQTQLKDSERDRGPITGMTVSRTVCKAVAPPLPMNTPIGCRNLWSEFPTSPAERKAIRNRIKLGEDRWRTGSAQEASRKALEDAAQRWGVSLTPGIQFTDCGKPAVVGDEEFSWCGWSDPDGMQVLSIEVSKPRSMRTGKEWGSAPWMLRRGHGVVCSVEQ